MKGSISARDDKNPARGGTSARRGGAERGSRGGARGGKTDIKKVISAFDIEEEEKKPANPFE